MTASVAAATTTETASKTATAAADTTTETASKTATAAATTTIARETAHQQYMLTPLG